MASPARDDGALLFLDLDQFKLINDTSGHRAGDELLAPLAAVMQEKLRPVAVLARLGGDEFGAVSIPILVWFRGRPSPACKGGGS